MFELHNRGTLSSYSATGNSVFLGNLHIQFPTES